MSRKGVGGLKNFLGAGLGLALLAGCAQQGVDTTDVIIPEDPAQQHALSLLPVSYAALPGWYEDQVAEALPALQKSCETFSRMPESKPIGPHGIGGFAGDWQPICTEAYAQPAGDSKQARAFFEAFFQPYLVSDLNDTDDPASGLFTGYYEAALNGAHSQGGPYQTPLYKRPDDLVLVNLGAFKPDWRGKRLAGRLTEGRLVPYASRAEIEAGKLRGKNLELVWVDDPVDAFFLHIQGSGRVQFADGSSMRVGYDGHNGHDYTSIGRILIDEGEVSKDDMSMQAIRKWMATHPDRGQKLMSANESFIFFRKLEGDGPIGAQGVALTPGRSLAIDKRFLPLGLPIYLFTFTDPLVPQKHLSRLMVTQDTGGAIKGVVRGDVFWGFGKMAAERAGLMKETGSYFALLPKNGLSRCQICEAVEDSPAEATQNTENIK